MPGILITSHLKELYFDSTRIQADSAWPTESNTIANLLTRIRQSFEILGDYDIKLNFPATTQELQQQISSLSKGIALAQGTKDSKTFIKKKYLKMLASCKKLLEIYSPALARARAKLGNRLPSETCGLTALLEQIEIDLYNTELCAENARERVLNGGKIAQSSKVLGISDEDAEIIAKGSKPPVFAFKPQVGRSETGYIASVLIPQGAASDSSQTRPIAEAAIAEAAIAATGIIPNTLSFDDGYTNKKDRDYFLGLGIKTISFSGSKGKKITKDEWEHSAYVEARNKRSMVESTMSTLKGNFGLTRFSRQGLKQVTQELLIAAIFHNISLLGRDRRKAELIEA